MKPRNPPADQDDLLRSRLVDMHHELVKLAALIDWDVFEREWLGFFPSHTGRPATMTRLVAGLLYLQHAYALSDEAVVARWSENPYWQHFCGETFFQHRLPLDPSSLTRWRKPRSAAGRCVPHKRQRSCWRGRLWCSLEYWF